MAKKKTSKDKPLTLKDLVQYNEDVLFPALEARFVTKDEFQEFKDEMYSFKDEMYSFKDRMDKFRDESLINFDAILKKLDILIDEKQVADYRGFLRGA